MKAILQVADTGPLESLVIMLRHAGYDCFLPSDDIKRALRDLGCDTVLDHEGLVQNWGYDRCMSLPTASMQDMETCDLYVDVKAHRNGPKVWNRWPRLQSRTLWHRINGGYPCHVVRSDGEDCGDEMNPPCPVLTPNLWYGERTTGMATVSFRERKHNPLVPIPGTVTFTDELTPWADKSYACWPPFYRFNDYFPFSGRTVPYTHPICLIHNVNGWGYSEVVEGMRKLGVRVHGVGSPDGLINHREVPQNLSHALAMVHLKSNDAPGYALYEALAAACPVVVTRRMIQRMKMQDLLEPDVTCLVFDGEEPSEINPAECIAEVRRALEILTHPEINRRVGLAGHERLKQVMWSPEKNGQGLKDFMERMYGATQRA